MLTLDLLFFRSQGTGDSARASMRGVAWRGVAAWRRGGVAWRRGVAADQQYLPIGDIPLTRPNHGFE